MHYPIKIKENPLLFSPQQLSSRIWKDAPYAFARVYSDGDMPGRPGRSQWLATTMCCNEEVSGSDYGEDEECPCCGKGLVWDFDGSKIKEYRAKFEKELEERNNLAKDEYKQNAQKALSDISKGLPDTLEGLQQLAEKIKDMAIEREKPLPYIYSGEIINKENYQTDGIDIQFGREYTHETEFHVIFSKTGISVSCREYEEYWRYDEDGHRDSYTIPYDDYTLKTRIPLTSDLAVKVIDSINTPEVIAERKAKAEYEEKARQLEKERREKEKQMQQKIKTMKEGIDKACKSVSPDFVDIAKKQYEFLQFTKPGDNKNAEYAIKTAMLALEKNLYNRRGIYGTDFILKQDGDKWEITAPKTTYTKSEDGTKYRKYSYEVIMSGEMTGDLQFLPKEYEYHPDCDPGRTRFLEKCKNNVVESAFEQVFNKSYIEDIDDVKPERENAYTFANQYIIENCVDFVGELDDDVLAEDFDGDEEEYITDLMWDEIMEGKIYIEAILEDGKPHCYITNTSDQFETVADEFELTPTEETFLMKAIGDRLQEKEEEIDLD